MDNRWMAGWVAAAAMSCGCIARGTRVSTPHGPRRVEELAVGDEVVAVNPETGEHAASTLVAVRSLRRECGRLSFGSVTLTVTSEHPLLDPATGRFHPAGDWLTGPRARLLTFDGARTREVAVDAREAFVSMEDVFDLSVAHPWHTFVAEGVVVHNKSWLGPPDSGSCVIPESGERVTASSASLIPCTCSDGAAGSYSCDENLSRLRCDRCGFVTADAGAPDGGKTDAGSRDAGPTDAGATDAGPTDAGASDGGPTDVMP